MRILRLHIENFGTLHDLDLEFQEGLQVFCRENGWGKSTLAAFIKAMFYGLPRTARRSLKENDRKHYLPWQGGTFGGSMEFQAGGREYRAERFFGARDRDDTFVLYDLRTGLESLDYSAGLGEELFGVDREAYERSSFFLQQDLLVSAGDSLNARLSRMEADAGDMKNYEHALSVLGDQMKYYQKTGNRGQIGKLQEAREAVREKLRICREQEAVLNACDARLGEQRASVKKAAARVKQVEKELRRVQDFRRLEAKKEQYDLLRSQAEEKQEELKEAAAALGEYTDTPPGEEKLDRYRERIYELRSLKKREKEAVNEANEARNQLGSLMDARDDLQSPGMFPGILAGLSLVLGGFCLVCSWYLPGGMLFCLGAGAVIWSVFRIRRCRMDQEHLNARVKESEEQVRKAQSTLRDLQKKRDLTEKKVCDFFGVPKHTDFDELERLWQEARRKSQRYRELKQLYEDRRKEAHKSRERWFSYQESISEEEKKFLSDSPGALVNSNQTDLRERLEKGRLELEGLQKEQSRIQYQIKGLQEQVEQMPELQEQEEALSEEISDSVRRHRLLELTMQYLQKARDQFSVCYLEELQKGLEHYLGLLEPEEALRPVLDVSLRVKVQRAGALRSLDTQSTGQQDLYRFGERLAVLDALYKEEMPPVIMDDPFVNLDAKRQRRAMELLKQLSTDRQILYFTCHEL